MKVLSLFLVFLAYHDVLSSVSDQTSEVGLADIEGVIAGYGDFNSDQATDVFVISKDCKQSNLLVIFHLSQIPSLISNSTRLV